MPATRVWRGTVRGIGLRQAPVGQPHQMQSQGPWRAGALWKETGKTGQRFLADGQTRAKARRWEGPGRWPRRAEEACPGHFEALWVGGRADGRSGKDPRKGVSVTDSSAVLGAHARLVVREGAFPPLCVLTRPSVANGLIFPSLSCGWGSGVLTRPATKHSGLTDRSGQILVSIFCTPGSAPEPFSWPGFSLTVPMSLLGLPSVLLMALP